MSFERSKEVLLNTGDEISKKYVANFIVDYLNINDTTAKLFNLNISDSVREKKIILLHHSRNERKLYNCEKKKEENNFQFKGRKRHFIH